MTRTRNLALACLTCVTAGMAGGASAQTTQGKSGRICRGVVSAYAANEEFVHVWVRVNADDSADVWTVRGPQVAPQALAPQPPPNARRTVTPTVSHFPNDFVGVNLPTPRGAPAMLSVSETAKIMATPRQRSEIACSP